MILRQLKNKICVLPVREDENFISVTQPIGMYWNKINKITSGSPPGIEPETSWLIYIFKCINITLVTDIVLFI